MTKESTTDKLLLLEREGKLVRFRPTFAGRETECRHISLTPRINDWLNQGINNVQLRQAVRAHFAQFVKGEKVDDLDFMKRVELMRFNQNRFDHEIWSMRPRFRPLQRFFGTFAAEDWFVIFVMRSRNALAQNGRNNSEDMWAKQIDKCAEAWAGMFHARRRFTGTRFEHYVTFASEHRDDRWNEL